MFLTVFLSQAVLKTTFFGVTALLEVRRNRLAPRLSQSTARKLRIGQRPKTAGFSASEISTSDRSHESLAMSFSDRHLAGAILGFSLAVFAAGPLDARAQEAAAGSATGGACPNNATAFADPLSKPHWNGWGVDPKQHRFQPADMARLDPSDAARLKLKWAFGFPGATRSVAQPTVFGGRVFIGSLNGKVYSLDAKSGCSYWDFEAGAGVRAAVVVGQVGDGWAAYFGDLGANVHSVDALTGKELWKAKLDDHPAAVITGSLTLVGRTLFVPISSYEQGTGANKSYSCCTFRGSLVALDASTGKVLWKSFTIAEPATPGAINAVGVQQMGPSGAAIWSAPTFDATTQRIYVTTGNNYSDPPTATSDAILALDARSGELAWSRQITSGDAYNLACVSPERGNCPQAKGPDFDFGSSTVLANLLNGKRILVAGDKSGVVTALDPDRGGEIVWQKRVGAGGKTGGVEWGIAADQNDVYVAVSDVRLAIAALGTPGAQPYAFNPKVGLLYNSKTGGGLSALKLETGEEIWRTPHPGCGDAPGCSPAQSAAVTAIPGLVFSGGLDGHLRAYFADNGKIAWDADTKADYQTVNGVAANGGSIDGGGAVVVDGMVYVGSGSGFLGGVPGNVLLAYSVDGQ
jgi:polyvinyl alcohol dehydrogenase (cytochrome)